MRPGHSFRPFVLCSMPLLAALSGLVPMAAAADELPRRARLGAQLAPSPDGQRLRVVDVFEGATLHAAGVEDGDVLLTLGGDELSPDTLAEVMRRHPAGERVEVTVDRGGEPMTFTAELQPRPMETADDILVRYESVALGDARLRTIVTRPETGGPFPALMFIPGLSCYSVDAGTTDLAYYGAMSHELARRGFLTLRVEKSGMGDSTGPPCDEIDFETEGQGYLAALRHLTERDDVEREAVFLFGHSMGGIFAPYIATRIPVKGIAVYGTGVRNWLEYMLNNNRRQMLMGGASWAETNDSSRRLTALLTEFHVRRRPLPEILDEHPDWAAMVQDREHFAGGRHYRFFHQLGDQNAAALWADAGAHALAIYGAADFVSNEDDHAAIADIVNREHPGYGRLEILEGMDHFFRGAEDFADSMRRLYGGADAQLPFDPRITDTLSTWMDEVLAGGESDAG